MGLAGCGRHRPIGSSRASEMRRSQPHLARAERRAPWVGVGVGLVLGLGLLLVLGLGVGLVLGLGLVLVLGLLPRWRPLGTRW